MAGEKLGDSQDPNTYVNVESINSLKEDDTDIGSLKIPSDPMFPPHDDHISTQNITELREQDRWLPINNVARLMKNTLPVSAKVSKDAKECMQECVSEFISFVTSEASDRCAADKRKTINGEDILISLHALGFENYAEVLKIYLAKYRQYQAIRNQQLLEEETVPEDPIQPTQPETVEPEASTETSVDLKDNITTGTEDIEKKIEVAKKIEST